MLWPLMIMAVGGLWLLMVADAFPEAVDDILKRSWPALLILFGFDVLFGRRRMRLGRWRLDVSLVGLVITLALVAGVVWFAYQEQADVVRADNVRVCSEELPEGVNRVRLDIEVERTSITVQPAGANPRLLEATFRGSDESSVTIDWSAEGDTGVLSLTESYRNAIPKLENYGRATLELTLPTGVIIEVLYANSGEGDVILDLGSVILRQITLAVQAGDITLSLPALDTLQGNLKTNRGDIELKVPAGRALDVKLAPGSGTPHYAVDRDRYEVLFDGELRPVRSTEGFQYALDVWMKGGANLTITDLP